MRSVWITGTGGIWYADWREERVFWGECSSCGKRVARRGWIFAPWKAYPGS
jgi:hypothetical protein